jgi:site-specific recombinase XerD
MPRTRRTQLETEEALRTKSRERLLQCGREEDDPLVLLALEYLSALSASSTRPASSHIRDWLIYCQRLGYEVLQVTNTQAKAYAKYLARKFAPTTIQSACAVIRGFYRTAIERDLVRFNPFAKVASGTAEPVVRTPAITQREFEQVSSMLFREATGEHAPLTAVRDAVMFYVVGRFGPRRFEVNRLRWSDLGHDRGRMVLRVMGKGRKPATMTLPDDVISLLEGWRERLERHIERPARARDAVFPSIGQGEWELRAALKEGGPLPPLGTTAITETFQGIFRRAGMGGARMATHVGRATAATIAYEVTGDIVAVQGMLRHANVRSTQGYLRRIGDARSVAGSWRPEVSLPDLAPEAA